MKMNIYKAYENYYIDTHQHFTKYIASHFGIQGLEIDALGFIHQNEDTNQAMLVAALGQNKTKISRLIDQLEAKKLVLRKQNPNNKREKIIVFAPRTYEVIKSYTQVIDELQNNAMKELTEEEIVMFNKTLNVMSKQVAELIKEK